MPYPTPPGSRSPERLARRFGRGDRVSLAPWDGGTEGARVERERQSSESTALRDWSRCGISSLLGDTREKKRALCRERVKRTKTVRYFSVVFSVGYGVWMQRVSVGCTQR